MADTTLIHPQVIAEIKAQLPSSYPIKRLTYLEMQQLRDQGLCLNCNNIDTPSHRCLVKRIVLVLPDEDPYTEQQPMESFYQSPQSEPVNQHLQPDQAEPNIGDSDLNGEKWQPPDNSEIISQPSNPYSIEIVDPKAAATHLPVAPPTTTRSAPLFSPSGCYGQKPVVLVGFKTLQSPLEMSINQLGKSSKGAPLVSTAGDGIKMHFNCQTSSATTEQYGHILFDVMLERDAKKIFERTILIFDPGVFADASTVFAEMNKFRGNNKIFIFDPGGTLAVKRVSDLEDKVDLEGVGIDTHINQPTPEAHARPRRTISVHPEGS